MATITGKKGHVKWGIDGFEIENQQVNEWSLDYGYEEVDTTQFSASGVTAKSHILGLADWTASITSNYSDLYTPLSPSATARSLLLYYDTTHYFESGSTGAYLTGYTITTPVAGKITVTYTFQGSGAITSLWTTD